MKVIEEYANVITEVLLPHVMVNSGEEWTLALFWPTIPDANLSFEGGMLTGLGHCFLFLYFRSEKNENLMREGGKKKHLRKKNIEPIIGKVNEGAQIKKTFDKFLEKLLRATK